MTDGSWLTTTVVCVDDPPRASGADHTAVAALLARGGRSLGDGQSVGVVAFASAASALDAAIGVQRDRAPSDPVRMGIAVGDLPTERVDRSAAAVFMARRLHQRAAAGQILASGLVLALARGVLDVPCRALANGGAEGVEVMWSPVASTAPAALPAPLAVAVTLGDRFVGRATEWAELDRAWNDVLIGSHRVVLVSGDAGAGKTRLAAEFAANAHRLGALVLYGGCDRDVRLPYQPWGQALESLVSDPPADIRDEVASLRTALAPLWPGRASHGDAPSDAPVDRYRVATAVGALLEAAARARPVVLVLDDLHWAGAPALELLRHVARAESCPNTLIVGTHSDAGVEHADALVSWLADLHRLLGVVRVRLRRLDDLAVEALIEAATGAAAGPSGALVAAITERSGGNAFYALELWRHLAHAVGEQADGRVVVDHDLAWSAVPDSVKEVLAPRLRRLSPSALRLAQLAAAAGERFDLDVLRSATLIDDDDLDRALDELADAGLLVRPSSAANGDRHAYQFAHRLVRDTVEESMPPLMRARLHLTLAESIERLHGGNIRSSCAELARHYGEAVPLVGHGMAAHYETLAAAEAMRAGTHDDAIAHLTSALLHVDDDDDRLDLFLVLATAQLRLGLLADSEASCADAFELAVQLGRPVGVARAALAFEETARSRGSAAAEVAERLRAALAVVDHDDAGLRVQLHVALGRAFSLAGRHADALTAIDHALVVARHVGDDEVLALALEAACTMLHDPQRLLAASEALDLVAERCGDVRRRVVAEVSRFRAQVGLGDMAAAAKSLERHRRMPRPEAGAAMDATTAGCEALLASAAGRFGDAEDAIERAGGRDAGQPSFDPVHHAVRVLALRREQGRVEEVRAMLENLARSRSDPVLTAALAALHAELGDGEAATRELDALSAQGSTLPRDAMWPAVLAFVAEAAIELGDERRALIFHDDLMAFRGRNLVAGTVACFGPADRLLAGLKALSGRRGEAEALFRSAHEMAERSNSPVWRVRVEHDWARFLADHDLTRARELRTCSIRDAGALGMQGIARELARGGSPRSVSRWVPAADRASLSARELDVLRLVAVGCSNREIGVRLFISSNTAANHVRAILQKTGCANRAQAVAYAARRHLLEELG